VSGASILSGAEGLLRRRELGPLFGFVALVIVFEAMSGQIFERAEVTAVTALAASVGTVAIGVTFLMIAGEFDLSVGAVFALSSVLFGQFLGEHGIDPLPALLLVLAIAAGIGLANGIVTAQFGIPSFITTLAALFIVQGITLVISQGNTILFFESSDVVSMLGGPIGDTGVAAPVLWFVGITAVMWLILERTAYGNWVSAAGGPPGVARAMGVPAKRVKMINFMVSSMLAAFAGCAQFASYGAASATDGQDYELYAIVAAVIGGTSLFGVTGTIVGTFIGALILGLLQSGLLLIGIPGSWYTPMIGGILVVGVILNVRLAKLDLRRALARFAFAGGDGRHAPSREVL
jgi:simple sugar transport system permease protein